VIKELEGLSDTASTFSMRHLQRGEILFQEGDAGEEAYLILSGYVEIFTEVDGERKFLATRGEGEIIGELAVFNKESRSASVRAVVPTVLKVMTEKAIETELEKLSPWVGQMISGLSHKFRTLNEQFVKQTSG
jgi:CRP-like cAMP-binding protein